MTFSKDRLTTDYDYASNGESVTVYNSCGGDFDLTYGLSVRASTTEERDNIVDVVGIYLAHPFAKDYFMKQYLVLPEAPKINGEAEVKEPGIDHPIYATEMSIRVETRWQEFTSEEYPTLGDVISDFEAYLDLDLEI